MDVKLKNLTKKFGAETAVDKMNLDIKDGEFVAFLGPSGCGKTTTLLMTAGIYKPDNGEIIFGDRLVNKVQPKDRNIGMVFQSYALYPHMSVYENIVFSMKLQKKSKKEMMLEADRVAGLLGIGTLLKRKPGQLSGGQQQRVALGRALIKKPELLLFDEPLSNLDARLRITMRSEIKRLQRDLGITSIYVTHDQVEAMTMADRVAVMKNGKLQAFMPPVELHEKPRTKFIAQFVGNPPMNFFDVELKSEGQNMQAFHSKFTLNLDSGRIPGRGGKNVVLGIRPEDIAIDPSSDIKAEILIVEPLGRDDLLQCRIGDLDISILADPKEKHRSGDMIGLDMDSRSFQFFDPESDQSLLWY